MKFIKLLNLFGVIFLFACCNQKNASDKNEMAKYYDYTIEYDDYREDVFKSTEYKSKNTFNNVFSKYMLNNNHRVIDDPEYRIEKLYFDGNISPIGWSMKGHFAYAQFYYSNDDIPYSKVIIFNIITDEIVAEVNNILGYYSEPSGGGFPDIDLIPFDEFWIKNNDTIIALLKRYAILYLRIYGYLPLRPI